MVITMAERKKNIRSNLNGNYSGWTKKPYVLIWMVFTMAERKKPYVLIWMVFTMAERKKPYVLIWMVITMAERKKHTF